MQNLCEFIIVTLSLIITNGWLVTSAPSEMELQIQPFVVDKELEQFDIETRDVKKKEVTEADLELVPEHRFETIPLLSEESLLTRRSRSDIYIGPARPNLREFHNW